MNCYIVESGGENVKIEQATIYGFGKWVDYTIDFTENQFTCVYGENESGKSTLQNFILFMLFGYPPKKRNYYRPKTSGKMGGRLRISDPQVGIYTIERLDEVQKGAARCFLADGTEYDETWLQERLRGMTTDIYQSIYSFSALDLQAFEEMKDEDLGEVLLGIGLTGSNNIYLIEKNLDQKLDALFKPNGKRPVINEQLNVLDQLQAELVSMEQNEGTYIEKQQDITMLKAEISELRKMGVREKDRLLLIEKQQNNESIIQDYHHDINQQATYPTTIKFPENGRERLQTLKESRLPIQSKYDVLKANLDRIVAKQEEMEQQIIANDLYEEMQALIQQKNEYEENKKLQSQLEKELAKQVAQIEAELDDLHIGLTRDELSTVTLPFHIEKIWNELKNNTEQLLLESEQSKQEKMTWEKQRDFIIEQIEEVEAHLLSEERINELNDIVRANKQADYLKKESENAAKKQAEWEHIQQRREENSKTMLIASLVFAILCAGLASMFTMPFLYNIMALSIIAGVAQWFWGKRSIQTMKELLQEKPVDNPVHPHHEQDVQEAERLLTLHTESKNSQSSLKNQLKALEIQMIQWNEKRNVLEQRERRINQQIESQHQTFPFLEKIEVTYWPEFYYSLKQLLAVVQNKQQIEKQMNELMVELTQYETRVTNHLKKHHQEHTNESVAVQFQMIVDLVTTHDESMRMLAESKQEVLENKAEQNDLIESMSIYEAEINKLYATSEVKTEDEFYEVSKMFYEKRDLEEKIAEKKAQLQSTFSSTVFEELIRNKPDQHQLALEKDQTLEIMDKNEAEIELKRNRLAAVQAELENMESSETHSNTIHQLAMEKEELNKLVREWTVLKTAKEMLKETQRNYRNKHLTKVIHKTIKYFKVITGEAYTDLVAPTSDEPFRVVSAEQIWYDVDELSKGTIDQLYICLRLAISEIMSEKHKLPFIMDDAFVHFDSKRMERMIDILQDISKNQQVILFTSRQEIIDSLAASQVTYLSDRTYITEKERSTF